MWKTDFWLFISAWKANDFSLQMLTDYWAEKLSRLASCRLTDSVMTAGVTRNHTKFCSQPISLCIYSLPLWGTHFHHIYIRIIWWCWHILCAPRWVNQISGVSCIQVRRKLWNHDIYRFRWCLSCFRSIFI